MRHVIKFDITNILILRPGVKHSRLRHSSSLAVCTLCPLKSEHQAHPNMSLLVTIFGLVTGADNALLSHEARQRVQETAIRKEARLDLARQGKVGTESEIARWKKEREEKERSAALASQDAEVASSS